MSAFRLAFCVSAPLLPHTTTSPTTTSSRPARAPFGTPAVPFRRAPPRPFHARRRARFPASASPSAQMPGNVEDLPLERIEAAPAALPAHWARAGVYGVYNADGVLQYVAATRNVQAAIATHRRVLRDPHAVHAVRMLTVDDADALPLGSVAETWVLAMHDLDQLPVGNGADGARWREEGEENGAFKADVYFRKRGGEGGGEGDDVRAEIRRVLREHPVVVFIKGTRKAPKCGFSKAVVEMLEGCVGDGFVCVDCLDGVRNAGLREGIKTYSKWPTIPQLYVQGDFVGGADIVKAMAESGELETVLKSSVPAP